MIKCVIQEYLSAIAPTVGKRMYSQELIYGHFSIFIGLYDQLRIDY